MAMIQIHVGVSQRVIYNLKKINWLVESVKED